MKIYAVLIKRTFCVGKVIRASQLSRSEEKVTLWIIFQRMH